VIPADLCGRAWANKLREWTILHRDDSLAAAREAVREGEIHDESRAENHFSPRSLIVPTTVTLQRNGSGAPGVL